MTRDHYTAFVTEAERISQLVQNGALFVINDSGGKDSQAMRIRVASLVPRGQVLVVHATLGEVEWPGALEHARDGAHRADLPFIVAQAPKTLLDMVEHRYRTYPGVPAFPQASNRQCTSDLKRDPIMREVRRFAKARGVTTIVTCMGIRAAESPRRAKASTLSRSSRGSVAGRTWYEWLPIHHLTTAEVFETIADAGESPHPAYGLGNERLSCVFCIMGSANDARNGAIQNPRLYAKYVEIENRTGYTVHQSRRRLEDLTGMTVAEAFARNRDYAA